MLVILAQGGDSVISSRCILYVQVSERRPALWPVCHNHGHNGRARYSRGMPYSLRDGGVLPITATGARTPCEFDGTARRLAENVCKSDARLSRNCTLITQLSAMPEVRRAVMQLKLP